VDQRQHPARAEGPAHQHRRQPAPRQRHAPPDERGVEPPVVARAVVDPDAQPVGPHVEAEGVAALHRLKRGDVKDLARGEPVGRADGPQVVVVDQVTVPVAEGVVDLRDHGAEPLFGVVAEPEAHRVEDVPHHPRLRQQEHPARQVEPLRRQHAAHPGRAAPVPARAAVVGVMQRDEPAAVAPEERGRLDLRRLRVEQDVVHPVAEGVVDRAVPAVPRVAREMLDPAHAATAPERPSSASATSCAEERPSSWKPYFIQAPQNHVRLAPFIAATSPCAASAAAS